MQTKVYTKQTQTDTHTHTYRHRHTHTDRVIVKAARYLTSEDHALSLSSTHTQDCIRCKDPCSHPLLPWTSHTTPTNQDTDPNPTTPTTSIQYTALLNLSSYHIKTQTYTHSFLYRKLCSGPGFNIILLLFQLLDQLA